VNNEFSRRQEIVSLRRTFDYEEGSSDSVNRSERPRETVATPSRNDSERNATHDVPISPRQQSINDFIHSTIPPNAYDAVSCSFKVKFRGYFERVASVLCLNFDDVNVCYPEHDGDVVPHLNSRFCTAERVDENDHSSPRRNLIERKIVNFGSN
jgi:hypothetical protein